MTEYTSKDRLRFWDKVNIPSDPDKCWEWQACKYETGYGQIRVNGHKMRTHRVSYELKYGDIPDGLFVCHKCDNRACCNPAHLFLGTQKDNMQDMVRKGRANRTEFQSVSRPGVLNSSLLTKEQVLYIRDCHNSKRFSQIELARQFGVATTTINRVVNRKSWKHV